MAYAVLEWLPQDVDAFVEALVRVQERIHPCPVCGIYTEQDVCEICADKHRSHDTLVVTSYVKDVYAFERIEGNQFVYHVLGGVLSAVKGIGIEIYRSTPCSSGLKPNRFEKWSWPPIQPSKARRPPYSSPNYWRTVPQVTRLAYGLPMGGHLDYADSLTLAKALANRTKLKGE
jgi:recombination protein RecR